MEIVQITAEKREALGKKGARATRKEGKIPAVIYSKKNGVVHFNTTTKDVKGMVYTPDFKLAEITIDGVAKKALLKDITFHPVTDQIEHIDFLELIEGHPIKASIPVKFTGTSPGVRAGGKLIRTLRTVGVKTTPEALVNELYVSIEELELGSAVRVRDIDAPEGIQILVDGAIPVANVEVPRALKSAQAGEDGAGDAAEGGEEAPAEGGEA